MNPRFHPQPPAAAWRGRALLARDDWEVELDAADHAEIRAALRATGSLPRARLDAAAFALPRLGPRLAAVRDSLEHGAGATRLRGLRLDDLGDHEIGRAFSGLAAHLGTPVSQTARGETLLPVRDARFADGDPRIRGPHTNRPLRFHTDRCDVIAFLCVRPAKAGGDNHLISSVTLYHELHARHPDAWATLHEAFPYLRHTVDPGNSRPFTMVPVFSVHEGRFAACLLRELIDRADRSPDAPDLTDAQRVALDRLEAVAEDPQLFASFRLEAGDVLLLNNWVTLHRRTAFEDHEDPARRRLLLRLWLSVPNSRALDPRFAAHFGATAAGARRGGIWPAVP